MQIIMHPTWEEVLRSGENNDVVLMVMMMMILVMMMIPKTMKKKLIFQPEENYDDDGDGDGDDDNDNESTTTNKMSKTHALFQWVVRTTLLAITTSRKLANTA